MGVLDREAAEPAKRARHFEMGDHDHHAEKQCDRIEIDGAKGFLEAERPERDHRCAAKKGDPGPVESQARNAARCDPDVSQRKDRERGHGGWGHSPGAPAATASSRARAIACSSLVSGIRAKKTKKASAAAAARKRNDAE